MTKKHFFVLLAIGAITVSLLEFAPKVLASTDEPRIDCFRANPVAVAGRETTTLTWETTKLTDCRITRAGATRGARAGTGGVAEVVCDNEVRPDGICRPALSVGTFILNCGEEGNATKRHSAEVTVGALPLPPRDTAPAPYYGPRRSMGSTVAQPPRILPPPRPLSPLATTSISPPIIDPPNCIVGSRPGVVASIRATGACNQLINIEWRGEIDESFNICETIISGSTPNGGPARAEGDHFSCKNKTDNWSLNGIQRREGRASGVAGSFPVTETQYFGIACTREPFMCGYNRSFTRAISTDEDMDRCNRNCDALRTSNIISVCKCVRDPWVGALQTVESRQVCHPSHNSLYPVRAIRAAQESRIDNNILRTDPSRPQILLNQLVNLAWNANLPDSDTPETMRCTPSIAPGGDGEGWTTGAGIPANLLDSLPSSGRISNLSPNVTTTYQLSCRDVGATDTNAGATGSNCCSNESVITASREVRVFTPDIREVPSFYDGFMRVVGIITNNLR